MKILTLSFAKVVDVLYDDYFSSNEFEQMTKGTKKNIYDKAVKPKCHLVISFLRGFMNYNRRKRQDTQALQVRG